MKQFYLLMATIILIGLKATAQFNYSHTNSKLNSGTYTDIASTGTAIPMTNLENGSSTSPQNIGFNFTFNGTVFTQFMIHADGILKFGTVAPGISTLIAPSPLNDYGNVFTNTTEAFQNIVMPLFLDLVQGTAAPQYHILTTGNAPNRVTTIQWKNLRDADNEGSTVQHQFENMEFQVKLYETSNNIEVVYGNWLSSTNLPRRRSSIIGIKSNDTSYISYTKESSLLNFKDAFFADPAFGSLDDSTDNNYTFAFRNITSLPTLGTTLHYYAQIANDINVAKLYVDNAVPQTPTIGKNIQALIKNEGTATAANIPVTLSLSGSNSNTETINITSLAAGDSQIVSFTPLVASAKGLQTVTISVNPTNDDRVENNSLAISQTVTQNLVKLYSDDKKSTSGFGFNGKSASTATKIFGTDTRNISQIRLSFITNNVVVSVGIYEDNGVGGIPADQPIFMSPLFLTNNTNEVIISVPTGISVSGDYYIAVSQRDVVNMGMRFYSEYPKLPQKIYNKEFLWGESLSSFNPIITVIQETNTIDIGFEAITAPQCAQTTNEVVKATIRNFSSAVHNYAINPVTVTGFVKDEVTNTTVPFNFIKNTGTIAAGARDTVTLLNSYNFTSRGNHVFVAKTICAADAEPLNDSLNFSIFTKITFTGVPIDSICPNTSVTLAIKSPYLRNPINFTSASDGSFVSQANTTITVKPNATTTYYARGLDYRGCFITDSVIVKVKKLGVPVAPVITTLDSVLSYKNDYSIVLTAPALAGHTITWVSSDNVVTNDGTINTITASSSFGFANTHKAFYTRIADGCNSVFSNTIANTFATGLLISDNVTTVCDTSFYDGGGPFEKFNSAFNIKTYIPSDPTKKLKLTINRFNIPRFSFMKVYDGSDRNAPQIGGLDPNTSEASMYEFVASNPSGTLTVEYDAAGGSVDFIGGLTCQTPLQFRTISDGLFTNTSLWESRPIGSSTFTAATRLPSKGDDSIFVFHNINLDKSMPLDQLVIETSGNMEVTGVRTFLDMYKTVPDNELTIKGIFKLNTGTFFGRTSTNILLQATLINNIEMETDSVKVFENTTPAIISGNGSINKLIINSSLGLLVNGNQIIKNKLDLTNGIVKINNANFLTFREFSFNLNGGSINSFIEGRLRRRTSGSSSKMVFPLGSNGLYRPLDLLSNDATFESVFIEYEAEMKTGAAPTRTLPATLTSLNGKYYHTVKIVSGENFFRDGKLTINYGTGDGVTDAPNLKIAKDDGGNNWLNIGGTGTTNLTGSITSNTFTTLGDFVLANTSEEIPLPLRLVSFTCSPKFAHNLINWVTENEINTAYFDLEKSTDGVTFANIHKIKAQGYGNSKYQFKDEGYTQSETIYYRLTIVDKDGKFEQKLISTNKNGNINNLTIYPNPVNNQLSLVSNKNIDAVFTNGLGQIVHKQKLKIGLNKLDVSNWITGFYFISTKEESIKFIKQ